MFGVLPLDPGHNCLQDASDVRVMAIEHAEILLREATRLGLRSRNQAIAFLGRSFRHQIGVHESRSDLEVCRLPVHA